MEFGQTEEDVRALAAGAKRHKSKLDKLAISVSEKSVAAVLAYTKEEPNLYADLNEACRTPGGRWEQLLVFYRDYLYLLDRAIQTFPNFTGEVYRGIKSCGLGDAYVEGKTITWQQFSSASKKAHVALTFLGSHGGRLVGSLFILQVENGKELEMCSQFPAEAEVLLPLNSHFKVRRIIKANATKMEILPLLKHYEISELVLYELEQL